MTITRQSFTKKDLPLSLEIEVDEGILEIKVFKQYSDQWPSVIVNFVPEEAEEEVDG